MFCAITLILNLSKNGIRTLRGNALFICLLRSCLLRNCNSDNNAGNGIELALSQSRNTTTP